MRHKCRLVCILAALLLWPRATFPAEPNWPATLTIGTASPGGTYFTYGEGLAKILTRELGIPVSARATEGPVQNIALLENGEIQLAFVTLGVALQAWNGTGAGTPGKPFRDMRALFPMYDTPFQFVVMQGSPIQSIADLSGKRIGAGPQGGTTATYLPEMLKALKIDAPLSYGDWADLARTAHGSARRPCGRGRCTVPVLSRTRDKRKAAVPSAHGSADRRPSLNPPRAQHCRPYRGISPRFRAGIRPSGSLISPWVRRICRRDQRRR